MFGPTAHKWFYSITQLKKPPKRQKIAFLRYLNPSNRLVCHKYVRKTKNRVTHSKHHDTCTHHVLLYLIGARARRRKKLWNFKKMKGRGMRLKWPPTPDTFFAHCHVRQQRKASEVWGTSRVEAQQQKKNHFLFHIFSCFLLLAPFLKKYVH